MQRERGVRAAVSIAMACRLSKVFGSTPEVWLGMQLAFDLVHAHELEPLIKVKRIAA